MFTSIISFLLGTAFLIAPNVFVMTGHQVHKDTPNDVYVMEGVSHGHEPLKTDCRELVLHEKVFTFGYPNGKPGLAVGQIVGIEGDTFTTSMRVAPGHSGSPVFDMDMEVIGVVTHALYEGDEIRGNKSTSICPVLELVEEL